MVQTYKTWKEKLDELPVGGYLVLSPEEKQSVNSVKYRDFHKDGIKRFALRTDRQSKEIRVFRIK
jgi:hypothetical protein